MTDIHSGTPIDIRQLAKILQVSVTTVSRVLNGKSDLYRISRKTSDRVKSAAKEYHYSANKIARGLKLRKSDTIGLLIPDISNPFFADMAHIIEKEARSLGYSMILCDSNGNIQIEQELISLLKSHKVDGMIVIPVGVEFQHILNLLETGMPITLVDRTTTDTDVPYVTSDNFQGAYDAVNYLISNGHTRIACIQGVPNCHPNLERIEGYKKAFEDNRIPLDTRLITGNDFSLDNGYRQSRLLFGTGNPPTAIFALSNLICLGVIKAIKEIGLKIPEDVSLVSFDEQPYSAFLEAPVTTVSQKKAEIARLALEILMKQIENKNKFPIKYKMKIKTDLIIRQSVKKLSV